MEASQLKPGDWVIYRKQKVSKSPGARATDVRPAPSGDTYQYMVEKYWVVDEVLDNRRVSLRTRRGKRNTVAVEDPRLRLARWWERLLYRHRFEAIEA